MGSTGCGGESLGWCSVKMWWCASCWTLHWSLLSVQSPGPSFADCLIQSDLGGSVELDEWADDRLLSLIRSCAQEAREAHWAVLDARRDPAQQSLWPDGGPLGSM